MSGMELRSRTPAASAVPVSSNIAAAMASAGVSRLRPGVSGLSGRARHTSLILPSNPAGSGSASRAAMFIISISSPFILSAPFSQLFPEFFPCPA